MNADDHFFRGALVASDRLAKPWLLLDWIYKLTDIASSEMNQKQKLVEFTRMVCLFVLCSNTQMVAKQATLGTEFCIWKFQVGTNK